MLEFLYYYISKEYIQVNLMTLTEKLGQGHLRQPDCKFILYL